MDALQLPLSLTLEHNSKIRKPLCFKDLSFLLLLLLLSIGVEPRALGMLPHAGPQNCISSLLFYSSLLVFILILSYPG